MKGFLRVIYGPMFSGKTTAMNAYLSERRSVDGEEACLLISSSLDDRPELNQIGVLSTHSNATFKKTKHELKVNKLSEVDASSFKVIGIDEGQFFEDLDIYVFKWLNEGKDVFVSGLIATSELGLFGKIHMLFPLADEITQRKAICVECAKLDSYRRPAIMTKCIQQKKDNILVGASQYISVCSDHWSS